MTAAPAPLQLLAAVKTREQYVALTERISSLEAECATLREAHGRQKAERKRAEGKLAEATRTSAAPPPYHPSLPPSS